MPNAKKLLVIDGNALVHRAYHALPPLKTKKGEMVNAIYGFCLIFLKALQDIKPDFVVATFDLKGPTFRHKEFPGYKAKRVKAPDELYQQIDGVKKVLRAFSVPIFEKQGFEADDLIGTIAKKSSVENIILSGDLDTLQLVDNKTKVYAMRKGIKDTVLYDEKKVKEKYDGLTPGQFLDFKALRGDPSDNIPGVAGIGEKTAIKLLKDFGSLDNLYQAIERKTAEVDKKIRKSVLEKLRKHKKEALLSRNLAEIKRNVEIDFNLEQTKLAGYNKEKVEETLKDFEFYALLKRLPEQQLSEAKPQIMGQMDLGVRPRSDPGQTRETSEIDKLQAQGVLTEKLAKMEKELTPVVRQMEENGIKLDIKRLNGLSQCLEKELSKLEKKIFKLAKTEFNLNSPQQISEVLFEKLKISFEGLRKTPGGAVSTGARELVKLKNQHPIIKPILDYRELFKLKSGFVDSLPKMLNSKTGRIHPHFHQLGAETGRMSCSEPNLQNIPVKGEIGKAIRRCFVAEKGFQFLSADYSQMELRVVANLAEDKKMIEFFRQNKDIHTMTATEIFEVGEEKVTKEQRKLAKTLNYGVLYGMGPHKFAENTGLSFREARAFIDKYFQEFFEVAHFIEKTINRAREKGFSATMFGRKRFLPEINSIDARLRAQAERIARNLPGQGSAADIMKMAMKELAEKKIFNNHCRLLLQIHDELLFEIKEDKIKELASKIKQTMEQVVDLKAPLKVEMNSGDNWGEMPKMKIVLK